MFEEVGFYIGCSDYLNSILLDKHKEILNLSMKKNKSLEVGCLWDISDPNKSIIAKGVRDRISLQDNPQLRCMLDTSLPYTLVFNHNHPRNTPFSESDFYTFISFKSLFAMTAVCNDGTVHMLRKEEGFNPVAAGFFFDNYVKKKKGDFTAIRTIAKQAKSLGLTYRCSVKRR